MSTQIRPGDRRGLAVHAAAVLSDEGRTFVFVHHDDDYYIYSGVKVGPTVGGWTEVTEGLTKADRVVAQGSFLLKSDFLRSKMGAGCAD